MRAGHVLSFGRSLAQSTLALPFRSVVISRSRSQTTLVSSSQLVTSGTSKTSPPPSADAPLSSSSHPPATSAPRAALALGFGGVIPFASGALVSALTTGADQQFALHATQLYGASILSFLGAVHWGTALSASAHSGTRASSTDLAYGVVPSLVGWAAALAPPTAGLGAMVPAFVGAYAYDGWRFGQGRKDVPAWYMPLRLKLTVGASSCMTFSAVVAQTVGENKDTLESDDSSVDDVNA
jgi:hypothetical protein